MVERKRNGLWWRPQSPQDDLHATDIQSIKKLLVGIKLAGAGIEEILCGGRRVAKRKQPPDRDRLTVYAIWSSRRQSGTCDKHRR
jgi:hypothetical protein